MSRDIKITILVTGSIAAYKAADIVSWLSQSGAVVDVLMTEAAQRFIAPLTFKTLSGRKVYCAGASCGKEVCLDMADNDLFLVLPATANIIAKAAHGVSDDLGSSAIAMARGAVIFFPAMHYNMYQNPLTQKNIAILKERGYHFVEPDSGHLACGARGKGRLADISEIKASLNRFLFFDRELSGVEVLITAGPTRERIDPVRYLSNFSSGKMGYALAEAALKKGARVNLVSGPTCLTPIPGVNTVRVESAQEMYDAVMSLYDTADIVIKAAAVADYHVKETAAQKIKKGDHYTLSLVKNLDILSALGKQKGDKILVGFAAETEDLHRYAEKKLREKNLDLIVANNVAQDGAGFEGDTNIISLISRDSRVDLEKMSKTEAAEKILAAVFRLPRFLEIKQRKSKGEG